MENKQMLKSTNPAIDHQYEKDKRSIRWKSLKRVSRWAACLSFALVVVIVWTVADDIRTLTSLCRIEGTNAYVMDYYCDYHLEKLRDGMDVHNLEGEFIDAYFPWGVAALAKRLRTAFSPATIGVPLGHTEFCSTVVYRNSRGQMLVGRNLDWKHDACLALRVHRAGKVTSIAVIDLAYLNMNRSDLIETSLWERIPLLFSPYYLQDGMNSDGIVITDMTLTGSRPPHDPNKPSIVHSTAMRLVLDDAKSTDQALELLQRYNIHFREAQCHFLIADATGRSVVVEYLNGVMQVIDRKADWQVCTNSQIWRASEVECDQNCDRYRRASARLDDFVGDVDVNRIMDVMDEVAMNDWTMWSSVYNLTTGEILFTHRKGQNRNKRTELDFN